MSSPHHHQYREPAVLRSMSYAEPREREPSQGFIMSMNIISVITHLLLGGIAFYAMVNATAMVDFMPFLSAHIYLSSIAYVILMSQVAISFNPYTWWMNNNKTLPTKSILYWAIQIAAVIMAVVGAILGFVGSVSHLKSPHGITGVVALVLTILSFVGSGVHAKTCRTDDCTPKKLLAVLVTVMLSMAFISLCLAIEYGRNSFNNSTVYFGITITVFALIGTIILTFGDILRKGCS